MSNFSLNNSFDMNRELLLEKRRAQEAERRCFGTSVLSELDGDKVQISNNAKQQKTQTTQGVVSQPQNEKDNTTTAKSIDADDGKISFKEKIKNFGKGIVAPIKNIFSSPKNIAITAVSALACAAIIGVTGGAAAPVFVAAGLLGGGAQIIKGIQKQSKATTDAQAKEAWQDMGSGTFAVGVSALGAKSSLKASGTNVKGMSTIKAAGKCIADVPKNLSKGFKTAKINVSDFAKGMKTSTPKSTTPKGKHVKTKTPDITGEKPVNTEKPIINIEETTGGSSAGAVVEQQVQQIKTNVPKVKEQALLPAPEEKLMLPAAQERLMLSAPEERLMLEAPKSKVVDTPETPFSGSNAGETSTSATNGAVKPKTKTHQKSQKHTGKNDYFKPSFWDRFKDFFRVFGFFKDRSIINK